MYIYQIMSNSFGYLDIILLGMIAGFIILRLRSILGRKTGHESKVYPNFAEKKFSMPKNDAEPSKQNLEVLEGKDKKEFLRGAEIAYESVLTSFATGDLIKLKALLSPNMFSNFSDAIKARNKENIKSEFTFIGVKVIELNFKIFVPTLCFTWFIFHLIEGFYTNDLIKKSISK